MGAASMLNRLTANGTAGWLVATLITGCLPVGTAEGGNSPAVATAVELMKRDLVSDLGKEVLMLTVTYPAAGASLPHRHDAQVFVYVLEGTLTMQVQGSPAVTLKPGETFYEGPDDVHVVSANSSTSKPAKILVVMIKDKRNPVSRSITE
jgi:quercetin dioxygenase-like cupin family protein